MKILMPFLFSFCLTGQSVYEFSIPAANGIDTISLSGYAGKQILIVNTALESNYTYQLTGLAQLSQTYGDSLVIIAVPSNSFGNEPNNDSAIQYQLAHIFNIQFPVAAKSAVAGTDALPLYQWLNQKILNGSVDNIVTSDFTKYLINSSGQLTGIFSPEVEPMSSVLQDAIKGIE